MWALSAALGLLAAGLMALGITPIPIRLRHAIPLELRAVGMDAPRRAFGLSMGYSPPWY